jgi:hypothetical protein
MMTIRYEWSKRQERNEQPNGLGISGGALIDSEKPWVASWSQNRTDLVGAKRRPLHALVGRRGFTTASS